MAKVEDITMKIDIRISLWTALKIRISGLFKNMEKFRQVGEVINIDYK